MQTTNKKIKATKLFWNTDNTTESKLKINEYILKVIRLSLSMTIEGQIQSIP